MQFAALEGGQAEGGGARGLGAGQLNEILGLQRHGDAAQGFKHFRERALLEPAAQHANAQGTFGKPLETRGQRLGLAHADRVALGIGPLQHVVGQGQVLNRPRERAHVVQALDEREDALARQAAIGGLQAEDAAQAGGNADRAVGVRAQGQGNEPRRHGRRRTARRAPGDPARIVWIAHRAVVGVLGDEAVGELVHVQRAHQDRPGGRQALTKVAS
jgi:hypothetical protein